MTRQQLENKIQDIIYLQEKITGCNINGNCMGDSSFYRKADTLQEKQETLIEEILDEFFPKVKP